MLLLSQGEPIDAGGLALDGLEHSSRVFDALLYFVVALLVCGVGAWVLLRMGWRYRDRLRDDPASPTTVSDIWSTHRVPPEDDNADSDRDEESADEP